MSKNKQIIKYVLTIFLFSSSILFSFSQSNLLEKRISISAKNQKIETVLQSISQKTNFQLSYNSDIIPVDSLITISYQNKTASKILNQILGKKYYFVTSGKHLIILRKSTPKTEKKEIKKQEIIVEKTIEKIKINGSISDYRSKKSVENVSIVNLFSQNSTLTDSDGNYSMDIDVQNEFIGISFSKENYIDTVILFKPDTLKTFDIQLFPKPIVVEKIQSKEINIIPQNEINNYKLVKTLVRNEMFTHSNNVKIFERSIGQFSIFQNIGTNRKLNGAFINHFSVNLISGYSNGVEGVELGGILNITKHKVSGFQACVGANINAGTMRGVQLSGIINQNYGNSKGFQATFGSNFCTDSVSGVQLSMLLNVVKKEFKGFQFSGVNYAKINRGFQLGFINISDSSSGISFGFLNIVKKGYYRFKLYEDEMFFTNVAFCMGTHKLYNIYEISVNPKTWALSLGYGTHFLYKRKISFTLETTVSQVNYNKLWESDTSFRGRISSELNFKISKLFFVFGGINYTLFVSDTNNSELQNYISETSIFKVKNYAFSAETMFQFAPGFSFGLKYNLN